MVFYGNGDTDERHDNKYSADNAVYKPQGTHVEASAEFIYKICDQIPPHDRSGENGDVSPDIMKELILRQNEVESRVKAYDKKEYQRIGECQQKTCHKIAPVVGRTVVGGLQRTCRIFLEQIDAESDKHRAADNLQHELMTLDQSGDETHAKACKKTVYQIAHCRSETGEERRPTAFAEGALYYEHPYRPHGG